MQSASAEALAVTSGFPAGTGCEEDVAAGGMFRLLRRWLRSHPGPVDLGWLK
jgi:hypothetical protein